MDTNVLISLADDCEPLSTNSSINVYPISFGELHKLTPKLGPFNGTQYSSESSIIETSSIVDGVIILDIHNVELGWIVLSNGSYSFSTNESNPPTRLSVALPVIGCGAKSTKVTSSVSQVVISLLSPSPKCAKWVRYFDVSSSKVVKSKLKAEHNLSTTSGLGNVKSPLSNSITNSSTLPFTALSVAVLYGQRNILNLNLSSSSSIILSPTNFIIFPILKSTVCAFENLP